MDEKSGAKVQNLLTKGSMNHLTHQLKKHQNNILLKLLKQ
jgi:hypothetical protein